MTDLQTLICDIERIISVPYQTSLKPLRETLEHTPISTVGTCALIKQCQITPLLNHLALRPVSDAVLQEIFARLIHDETIFQAILVQHPIYFESLCREWMQTVQKTPVTHSNTTAFHGFLEISLPLESSLPNSFIKLIETVIQSGALNSDQSSHLALKFLCLAPHYLIFSLSNQAIETCFDLWKAFLRSEDENAILCLCLASQLITSGRALHVTGTASQPVPASSGLLAQWTEKCRHLFAASKINAIIERIVLTILKWCSVSIHQTDSVSNAVVLASQLLQNLDVVAVANWCQQNAAVVRKLANKIQRPELSSKLQSEVLGLLIVLDASYGCLEWSLLTSSTLPKYLSDTSSSLITRRANLERLARNQLTALLHTRNFCSEDKQSLRSLVEFLRSYCRLDQTTSPETFGRLLKAQAIVATIETLDVGGSHCFLEAFLRALFHGGITKWWPVNFSTADESQDCTSYQVCLHCSERIIQQLCSSLTCLSLRYASTSTYHLDHNVFNTLQKCWNHAMIDHSRPCQFPRPLRTTMPPAAPGEVFNPSLDWRTQLQSHLSARTLDTGLAIERFVNDVCKDLQDRCDNVEIPVRNLEAKCKKLEEQLQHTTQDLSTSRTSENSLQAVLNEKQEELEKVKASVELLHAETRMMQRNQQKCLKEIHDAHEYAKSLSKDHVDRLAQLEEDHLQQVASIQQAHNKCLSALESHVVHHQQQIVAVKEEFNWRRDEAEKTILDIELQQKRVLSELREQHVAAEDVLRQRISELEVKLSAVDAELNCSENELQLQQEEVKSLGEQQSEDRQRLQTLQNELERATSDAGERHTELEEMKLKYQALSETEAAQKVQLDKSLASVEGLKRTEAALRQQCKSQEMALKKTQQTEASVLAILQRARHPVTGSDQLAASASQYANVASSYLSPGISFPSENEADADMSESPL